MEFAFRPCPLDPLLLGRVFAGEVATAAPYAQIANLSPSRLTSIIARSPRPASSAEPGYAAGVLIEHAADAQRRIVGNESGGLLEFGDGRARNPNTDLDKAARLLRRPESRLPFRAVRHRLASGTLQKVVREALKQAASDDERSTSVLIERILVGWLMDRGYLSKPGDGSAASKRAKRGSRK